MKWNKILNRIVLLYMVALMLWFPSITVHAEVQITEVSKLMAADKVIKVYEEPSAQSTVIVTYKEGDHVLVTGETANGWYRVAYRDKNGYVRQTDLKETELNVAALDEEFAANEIDGKIFVEEVERIRAQITRSRIWGAVIIVLIIGIFSFGIYSTIQNDRKLKLEKQGNTEIAENGRTDGGEIPLTEKSNADKVVEKKESSENEDDIIEPLSFDTVEMTPLDMIDLDKQEL